MEAGCPFSFDGYATSRSDVAGAALVEGRQSIRGSGERQYGVGRSADGCERWGFGRESEVIEDLADDVRVGEEGEDLASSSTEVAVQNIQEMDALHQVCPGVASGWSWRTLVERREP